MTTLPRNVGAPPEPHTAEDKRVVYLVSQYPALSHAFVTQEIEGLEADGWMIHRCSLRRARPEHLALPSVGRESGRTLVLQQSKRDALMAITSAARRSPRAFGHMLQDAASPLFSSRTRGSYAGWPSDALARAAYVAQASVLIRHLTDASVRHVHVHFANNAAEVARLACRYLTEAGSPTTYSLTLHSLAMHGLRHEDVDDWPHASERRWGSLSSKIDEASFTSCISDFCRQRALDVVGHSSAYLPVVHMGVDTERFSPAALAVADSSDVVVTGLSGLDDDRDEAPVILFVGRLAIEKGALMLLDAAEALLKRGQRFRLLVAGDGPLRHDLEQRLQQSPVLSDAVHLMGPMSNDELPDLYRRSDLFCLPSTVEGVPVVLMEAMACGLPVISTKTDGIPELVEHGVSGVLIDRGDVHQLEEALAHLLDDPSRRRALGRAARERVSVDYDTKTQVLRMSRVLSSRGRR